MTLLTENYRQQLAWMHRKHKSFGAGSRHRKERILSLGYGDILDYGCGKGWLGASKKYDPAIQEFSGDPEPADLVVCTDVLEHVEPELLDDVLKHIASKMLRAGYFTIGCAPAAKKLPDGRNAHLIVKPPTWWLEKLSGFFVVEDHQVRKDRLKRGASMELEVVVLTR